WTEQEAGRHAAPESTGASCSCQTTAVRSPGKNSNRGRPRAPTAKVSGLRGGPQAHPGDAQDDDPARLGGPGPPPAGALLLLLEVEEADGVVDGEPLAGLL